MRLADRHALDRDRHVGALAAMVLDERPVIHLVDVVAGEDEDDVARLLADRLDVGQHRIGRAAIPLRGSVARDVRLHHADAALVAVEVPRPPDADVVVERARVVLGQDEDVVDLGVDAVREREVDDPVLAREGDGGLGADAERSDRRSPSPPARTTAQRASRRDATPPRVHRGPSRPTGRTARQAAQIVLAANSVAPPSPAVTAAVTAPSTLAIVASLSHGRRAGRGAIRAWPEGWPST